MSQRTKCPVLWGKAKPPIQVHGNVRNMITEQTHCELPSSAWVRNLRIILDPSLLHSHHSSAFFCPRGFPEPSPEYSQQHMNVPILPAKAPGPSVKPHLGWLRAPGSWPLTSTVAVPPPLSSLSVRPTAAAQTLSLTWTATAVQQVCPADAPWVQARLQPHPQWDTLALTASWDLHPTWAGPAPWLCLKALPKFLV